MRLLALGLFALIAFSVPAKVLAQEEDADSPYWYVTHWKIAFSKVDSLVSLEKAYSPRFRETVTPEQTGVLDRKVLIHDTGGEATVVIMTKHPTWRAIREDAPIGNVMEHVFPDEPERQGIQEAYQWVFEGAEHWDAIYREAEEIPEDE